MNKNRIFRICQIIGWIAGAVFVTSACQTEARLDPSSQDDPLYSEQWHLKNTGQNGGVVGEDINVEPVWQSCGEGNTCRGEGVVVVVVDGGVQIIHEDLEPNIVPGSYNYATLQIDPTPIGIPRTDIEAAELAHGTAIAGLVAARDGNGLGGRGVAPRAGVIGFNLLENDTSFNEAASMIRGAEEISISLNSWGVSDGLGQLGASEWSWQQAIRAGLNQGRNGKGTIYFWAAGNGNTGNPICKSCKDNSNYDGQANDRGVIAVAAVNEFGKRSTYSEKGANLWISAPGGEFCRDQKKAVTTTDMLGLAGFNPNLAKPADYRDENYTACMNGTSASVPIAGGVAALVLQANPSLGWRDVRLILAKTARKVDPSNPDWQTNGAGYPVNHQYGFGVVDAQAAVQAAKSWKNLGQSVESQSYSSFPDAVIPDGSSQGISDSIQVSGSPVSRIEWIEVTFKSDHVYSGDLDISLVHQETGTVSRLAEQHDCLSIKKISLDCLKYENWVFGDARHLGESSNGSWNLVVRDLETGKLGNLLGWSLKFYGT